MSKKLSLSAALSVLMMAGFVAFGTGSTSSSMSDTSGLSVTKADAAGDSAALAGVLPALR